MTAQTVSSTAKIQAFVRSPYIAVAAQPAAKTAIHRRSRPSRAYDTTIVVAATNPKAVSTGP